MSAIKRTPRSSSTAVQMREKKKPNELKGITVAEFYAAEDAEATSLEWKQAEEMFREHSEVIRQLCNRFCLENSVSFYVSVSGQQLCDQILSSEETANLGESLMSHLISLRRLNRLTQFKNRMARDRTADERGVVDERFLQLQNVQSEIEHLQKEISRCVEFGSADEDIELVPLEEFYANASTELKEAAKQNPHQERIARLEWELVERKSLVATLQEREGRKNVLISDISTKEHRLKSLKPMIESLIEGARPVQELMGLNSLSSGSVEQRQLLGYLPKELFVIIIQVEAYADIARGDKGVSIRCEGDIENATKFVENEQRSESGVEDESESTDADVERDRSPSRLRRRRNTLSEQMTRKRDAVLATHPIHLILDITCSDGITVSLQLQYIQELRSIGVLAKLRGSSLPFHENLLCDESVLMELYPGDRGEKCPNAVSQVKLDQFHMTVSEYESKVGRMYAFAQRMAGLNEGATNGAQLCDVVQSVVEKVRARVRSRCALIKCVLSLRSLKLFEEMQTKERNRYPMKILSALTDFKMITAEDFLVSRSCFLSLV
ncbi:unnamed protein product [Toxocara canis]|uniref:THO complex subunit 5 n=1 Tax=Toxocara canis TaxID=6265 RepID=A0A183TZ41_TOXCA|nr:unnamed protein product [Toxocara canis]